MEKNKVKKFKAFVNPRYLYGQAPAHVLISDLKEYNNHRYKVFTVHPRVDDKPLKMNPTYYINSQRLINDALRLQEIDKQNKDLVKKINTINQMGFLMSNPLVYSISKENKCSEFCSDTKE